MSWYVTRTVTYKLPKGNSSFIQDLRDKGIVIPEDVKISQGTRTLDNKLWEDIENSELEEYFMGGLKTSDYSFQDDMKSLSSRHPSILFIVECESAEDGVSMWREYYKDGKTVELNPEIVYPEFKESMLK